MKRTNQCSRCRGKRIEKEDILPDGVPCRYWECTECGEKLVDMGQLEAAAKTAKNLKRYPAKLTPWGVSLGLRIPRELTKKYKLTKKSEVTLILEKEGIRIVV